MLEYVIFVGERGIMKQNKNVANTILEQLGGPKFFEMTGAKRFVAFDNAVTFRIPKAKGGINMVSIYINEEDLYNFRR